MRRMRQSVHPLKEQLGVPDQRIVDRLIAESDNAVEGSANAIQ